MADKIIKVFSFLAAFFIIVFVLEASIAVHEYGHLKEFQKQNIPVQEFSLGFGPLLYQYQAPSCAISLRLLPLGGYVAPTAKGGEILIKKTSAANRMAVYAAGPINNLLVGLGLIVIFQIIGWRRGNLSFSELLKTLALTPLKICLRFFVFLLGCVTFGYVNLTEKALISTGNITPPRPIKFLIFVNLVMGLLNFSPVLPLDGGHVAQQLLLLAGSGFRLPDPTSIIGLAIFIAFFTSTYNQDLRMFESEKH